MLHRAYTQPDRRTHRHTVERSKINTVRATMIPLHYLHTGPPSCACLPHCPLHCFSVEVVITKANISFSLRLHLPSTSPSFLSLYAAHSSALPAFCQLMTQLKVRHCWWQYQCDSPRVCVSAVLWDYAQLMCNKGAVCYPRFRSVSWGKRSLWYSNGEIAWCTTAVSVVLYIVGVTGWDQRDVPSFMAFFITSNALAL